MSLTLLELLVAVLLIAVAWQLGIALAPRIFQALRGMRHDLDEVSDEALGTADRPHKEQHTNGTHSNR